MSPEVNDAITVMLMLYVFYLRLSLKNKLKEHAKASAEMVTKLSKKQFNSIGTTLDKRLGSILDMLSSAIDDMEKKRKKIEDKV